MDNQTKITSSDLPEPKRVKLTPEQRSERRFRLWVTLYAFIAGYACLHKLLVPFVLSFTSLYPGPYTQIDYWFIHPALTWAILSRDRDVTKTVSLLSGIAVAYGILELWEVFQGHYVGWLVFSRLLSSLPFALASLLLMTRQWPKKSSALAWAGAALFFALFLWKNQFSAFQAISKSALPVNPASLSRSLPLTDLNQCGLPAIGVKKGLKPSPLSQIELKECGFFPAGGFVSSSGLKIKNSLPHPLNIHFAVYKNGTLAHAWNTLLLANEERQRDFTVPAGSFGVVYTDIAPQMGMTVVFPGEVEKSMVISRAPLKVEEFP